MLPVQEYRDINQNAEADPNCNSDNGIKDHGFLIGFSRLAIVLSFAVITLHKFQKCGTERTAPPRETDPSRAGASAIRTRGILSQLILRHTISSTNDDGDKLLVTIILSYFSCALIFSAVSW